MSLMVDHMQETNLLCRHDFKNHSFVLARMRLKYTRHLNSDIYCICRSLWFFLWEPPLSRKPWRWVWKSITIWRSVCTLHEFPSSKMYHLNFLKLQSCQTKPFHYSVAKLCFLPVIKWVLLLET
jgi:hypothetical protein